MTAVYVGRIGDGQTVPLTAEQAEFDSVEGELDMRFQELRDSHGPDGSVWAGVVTIEPVTIHYTFQGHETIHILDGEVSITVEGERTVDLQAGDVASFTKGSRSKWVVKSTLREFFVLTGV